MTDINPKNLKNLKQTQGLQVLSFEQWFYCNRHIYFTIDSLETADEQTIETLHDAYWSYYKRFQKQHNTGN